MNRSKDMRNLLDKVTLTESQALTELNDLPNSTAYDFAKWGESSARFDRPATISMRGNKKTRAWLESNGEEIGVTFKEKKSLLGRIIFALTGPSRVVHKVAKTLEDMGLGFRGQPETDYMANQYHAGVRLTPKS